MMRVTSELICQSRLIANKPEGQCYLKIQYEAIGQQNLNRLAHQTTSTLTTEVFTDFTDTFVGVDGGGRGVPFCGR